MRDIIGIPRWDRTVPIMSLIAQNTPVLLNVLDIIIMLLTDYESMVLKIWFGMDIAHEENVDKEVDRSSIGKTEFRTERR